MTEYNLRLQKIVSTIQYPENIKPYRQICCKHKDNIYIIDGENGEIIVCDTVLKTLTKKISIPKIGQYPSAVVICDEIHILFGDQSSMYLVYDINRNELHSYPNILGRSKFVTALLYQNRIILFGGWSYAKNEIHNEFRISNEIHRNHNGKISWNIKDEFKFSQKPVYFHGYILYKHYLFIFGGGIWIESSGWKLIDSIYYLDLNKSKGWKELKHIKCPYPGQFITTITDDNVVHLFAEINEWPNWKESKRAHYSVPISTILGSEFVSDFGSRK